jgi:uncharacterized protein YceK
MRKIAALIAVAASLYGCGTVRSTYENPTVISANPSSITYQYRNGRFDAAQSRATDHCAPSGRSAVMERVLPAKANFSSAVFNCV